jgi:hypothetical protein
VVVGSREAPEWSPSPDSMGTPSRGPSQHRATVTRVHAGTEAPTCCRVNQARLRPRRAIPRPVRPMPSNAIDIGSGTAATAV